jgi:hypothetical protein
MKKLLLTAMTLGAVVSVLTLSAFSNQNDREAQRLQEAQKHSEWVAKSLKEIQTVKAGMTRADLLKVFTEEGGLSTRKWRTYAYHECPYIKVDVKFEPVADGGNSESPDDKIVEISKPYLDWQILD